MNISSCSLKQRKLCGRKECDICYQRSLQKFFDDNDLNHCWVSERNPGVNPLLVMQGSHMKLWFKCKRCGEEYKPDVCKFITTMGCSSCGRSAKLDNNKFTQRAREVHGDKFDYSEVIYINAHTYVTIICKKHDKFLQAPNNHLQGQGCPRCGKESMSLKLASNTEEFIKKSILVHGDLYDYPLVNYINAYTDVCIICKKHGPFRQIPSSHLKGHGCAVCTNKTEGKLKLFLEQKFSDLCTQAKFEWCPKRRYDFYIPSLSVIIELDGPQHFQQIHNWQSHSLVQKVDAYKALKAIENGISVIRLLQDDVWNDTSNWREELIKAIHSCSSPTVVYLHDAAYSGHKELYDRALEIKSMIRSKSSICNQIMSRIKVHDSTEFIKFKNDDTTLKSDRLIRDIYKMGDNKEYLSGITRFFTDVLCTEIEMNINNKLVTITLDVEDSLYHLIR